MRLYGQTCTFTLLNRERQGLLKPLKTPEDIEKLLGMLEEKPKPKVILYALVSTKKQEEYLKNQIKRLVDFAKSKGWNYEVISEIASGVNENRKQLRKHLNIVKGGEVEKVVEENEEDRTKELAEDLIAIVASFAVRVYGNRGGRKSAKS